MSKAQDHEFSEELPVGYYLDNFQRILDFVDSHYDDILTDTEKTFSQTFGSLSLDARRLYVRLISRKGPLFRSDTLDYGEIRDVGAAADELITNGFLQQDEPWELAEELALLRKAEILDLIKVCHAAWAVDPGSRGTIALKRLRKEQLAELALSLPDHTRIREHLRSLFHLYRPLKEEEIRIYRLLFFGNLYQDLTEFVVTDLGHVRYESYEIRREDRLFHSREVVEQTRRLIELNDAFYQAVEGRSVYQVDTEQLLSLLEYLPERSALGEDADVQRMLGNLINGIARHLERTGDDGEAMHLYKLAELPPARERQIRILERQGSLQEALQLCREIVEDPYEEAEQEFARRYTLKLSKKLGLPIAQAPVVVGEKADIPFQLIELKYDPQVGVEESVLARFKEQGFTGYHGENILWTGLFGLAFWDIVFLSLPGTFFNRYQRGPRDLFRPEFRRRRSPLIEERLSYIRNTPSWTKEILERYDNKQGIACDLMQWKFLPRDLVERSLRAIPRDHLVRIFDKLSEHPGANKSGFPDLILFAPAGRGKTLTYELIEVKGPGDQLQINQRRWLRYFSEHGIPHRVIRVRWRE